MTKSVAIHFASILNPIMKRWKDLTTEERNHEILRCMNKRSRQGSHAMTAFAQDNYEAIRLGRTPAANVDAKPLAHGL